MAQTLNFAIQVDQSQLPAAIQQLQSGINTQLQSGALQLGTMANGLSATMAGMNALGVTPSSMGFAHAVAPGQVNYALGRQPFVDRTASILDFMNQAGGAVKMRASSIVAGMDANKIAPTIGSDSRWGGVGKAALIGAAGFSGFLVAGPAGAAIGAKMGMTGMAGSMLAFSAGSAAWGAGTNYGLRKAGIMTDQMTPEQLQKLTIERRGYADIAGTFMALGPQKYLPQLGQELDTTRNIKFGESIAKAFIDRQDFSIINRAAGKNPSYLADVLTSLAVTDRGGFQKYVAPLHSYAGANAAAAPEHLTKPFVSYVNAMELQAQANGYASVSSMEYKRNAAVLGSGRFTAPEYTGPNSYQMMGRDMGTKMRMGKQFGSDFVNSLRDRVRRDLGMSPEERKWSGGSLGIAGQYASVVMGDMATFGSGTSIAYAAKYAATQGGGPLGKNIYDVTAQAAGVFTDPRQYVKFRLNYKDIVRSGGATDALYRRNQVMIAREMKQQSGGAFENEEEALRMKFENEGMNSEQARVQTGVILGIGRNVVVNGGGGGKIALSSVMTDLQRKNAAQRIVNMKSGKISYDEAYAMTGKVIWNKNLFPQGLDLNDLAGLRSFGAGGKDPGGKYKKQFDLIKKMGLSPASVIEQDSVEGAMGVVYGMALQKSFIDDPFLETAGRNGIGYAQELVKHKGAFAEVQALTKQIAAADFDQKIVLETKLASVLAATGSTTLSGLDARKSFMRSNMEGLTEDKVKGYKKSDHYYSGSDGKGGAGEYDIEVAEKDWNAGLEQMTKGMSEFIKILKNKGK